MQEIDVLKLSVIFDDGLDEEAVLELLSGVGENYLAISIQYHSLGFPRSHVDIMMDYLRSSFCSEEILKYSELMDYERDFQSDKFNPSLILRVRVGDREGLAETLVRLAPWFAKTKDADEDDIMSLDNELEDYQSKLDSLSFKIPDEIDNYYANAVHGGYSQLGYDEDDSVDEDSEDEPDDENPLTDHPERTAGIWKSAASNSLGVDFYVSSSCWILPKHADHVEILKRFSGLKEEIVFEQAYILHDKERLIALSNTWAVDVAQLDQLETSLDCAQKVLYRYYNFEPASYPALDDLAYLISTTSDVIVVESIQFKIVFFHPALVKREDIYAVREMLMPKLETIETYLGLVSDVSCPWDSLDEESFEELCCDILRMNILFDDTKIRKMGKSKSRDGGRDIVAFTREILGRPSVKYIFQCKLIRDRGSLGKSKLPEAATSILEYGPAGYGVFTSGIIDATLHDMLDGVGQRLKIDTSIRWSVYDLERFLASNRFLKGRYFSLHR